MSKKIQYGRDLPSLIADGMLLSLIMARVKDLRGPIDEALMLHNLYETFSLSNNVKNRKRIKDNTARLKATLTPQIAEINELITLSNKMIKGLDFDHTIPKLKASDVTSLTKQRLQTLYKVDDVQKLSNSHFRTQLGHLLEGPAKSIHQFIELVRIEEYADDVKTIQGESYRAGIQQAIHICSIGYYSTAVFIAGRSIEEIINDYFKELFRLKIMNKFDLQTTKFKDKIGKLQGNNLISEEYFHRLSNIRIDRNEFGHPSSKLLSKKQAHLRIRLIIEVVPEIEKKLKKLKVKT